MKSAPSLAESTVSEEAATFSAPNREDRLSIVKEGGSMKVRVAVATVVCLAALAHCERSARGQSFGVELHNTLMPASGAMAGASLSRPQDLTSAVNANPATLAQFEGTQFLFGGAWTEPTFFMSQTAPLPLLGVDPFAEHSTAPGTPVGNIGVTQELSVLDVPVTLGMGFITSSGGMVDFRQVPQSNGTNSASVIFSLPVGVGFHLTERLQVGASLALGIAFFDGPFVGLGGMTPDYALRGATGVNYNLTDFTSVGAYFQTGQSFQFDNALQLANGDNFTVQMDLPQNVGVGVANNSLADGNFLVAVDFLYKLWDGADLYKAVYDNQFVVQVGTQYTMGNVALRAGYAWAEDPLSPNPEGSIGGIVPAGGIPAVRYTQALLAVTSQHRISFGVGLADFMIPGMNMDVMAGGMLRDVAQEGPFTSTYIEGYWIGFGLSWQFGAGAGCGCECDS
jgi:long-chain fatty acid transport protein